MANERVVIEIDVDARDVDSTIRKLEKFGKVSKQSGDKFRKASKTIQNSSKSASSGVNMLSRGIKNMAGQLAAAFAIQRIVSSAIESIVEFEKAIASLSAITGATGDDLKYLSDQAIAMGAASGLGAAEMAKAFELVGSKKPELLESGQALAGVTKQVILLSQASGMELTDAATSLTDVMNQFNLSAEESSRVVNVLAAGSKFGAVAISGVGESIVNFGAVAASANVSVEESVALVEMLGEKGIAARRSGIQLKNILIKLQAGADDTNPAIVGISQALENLAAKQLSVTELTKMFGLESVVAAQILQSSTERVKELTEAVTDTNTATEQAAKNQDTIAFKWNRMKASIEATTLALNESNEGFGLFLKNAIDGLTELLGPTKEFHQIMVEAGYTAGVAEDKSLKAQRRRLALKIEEHALAIVEAMEVNPILARQAQKQLDIEKARLVELDKKIEEMEKIAALEAAGTKTLEKKKKKESDVQRMNRRFMDDVIADLRKKEEEEKKAETEDIKRFNERNARRQKENQQNMAMARSELANDVKNHKEKTQAERDLRDLRLDTFRDTAGASLEVFRNLQKRESDIAFAELERRRDKGIITDEQYQAERKKILQKQAKQDKALALFDIAIGTAVAIAQNAGKIPLQIAAAVTGAAQAAVVASQPIPQLRKGGTPLDAAKSAGMLRGKSHEQGGILIEAEGNEYLMPTKQSIQYRKYLDDMRMGTFKMPEPKLSLDKDMNLFDDQNIVHHLKRGHKWSKRQVEALERMSRGKHINQRNRWAN